jgi:hypothetical protein
MRRARKVARASRHTFIHKSQNGAALFTPPDGATAPPTSLARLRASGDRKVAAPAEPRCTGQVVYKGMVSRPWTALPARRGPGKGARAVVPGKMPMSRHGQDSRATTALRHGLQVLRCAPLFLVWLSLACMATLTASEQPRVLVTTDGEIDDRCSMVRFLLYTNEWDVEGIVLSSSQYHWEGSRVWAGNAWVDPFLDAYAQVHPNLIKHDVRYPTAGHLRSRTFVGNIRREGEMDEITPGSQRIVEVLLDDSDPRPVWLQAWGGTNTIARALKTIEEDHPGRMAAVAKKIRLYLIWEQDNTYQSYIRPRWSRFGIPTVISDQFIAMGYEGWRKQIPEEKQHYFSAEWMNRNILRNRGPLLALYEAFDDGRFRSEGDSPAFLHVIPTGLRSAESPDWGGWGGRFVRVRNNTWLDPVLEPGYQYPEGRWYTRSAWGRERLRKEIPNDAELTAYLKPQWRWIDAIQNDFAARADWCVKDFKDANHAPVPKVVGPLDRTVRPGETVKLAATATDPDGDRLTYKWWHYADASSAESLVTIANAASPERASFVVPNEPGRTVHIILEVTDDGTPPLTRYQRIVFTIR